jgi:glycosyltransferase involved in cell wall biosynthesis
VKFILAGYYYAEGGGYTRILQELGTGLCERGHEVIVLGVEYNKSPHYFPFRLVPIEYSWTVEALRVLPDRWDADRIILAFDVPRLDAIVNKFLFEDMAFNVWGMEALFPVESEPLLPSWEKSLALFKNRYVISEYGVGVCEEAGLHAQHFPIGCKIGKAPKSKIAPREMLQWDNDKKIYLTVSTNHDRKALPLAMEAFSKLPEDTHYFIVTNPEQREGWDLQALAQRYGIEDRYTTVRFGLSPGVLSTMYWAADALVVPSQAEGACLPIYEAAAHGLPVICGDWTGMGDVAGEDWVMNISYDVEFIHPWGNSTRWMASVEDIHEWMMAVYNGVVDGAEMSQKAYEFADSRKWSDAVNVIEFSMDGNVNVEEESTKEEAQEVSG